ncbi:FAD binding domain-containing protein [Streptomyces longwoodensis]|uniref:FAD binding domain-containing protein n=1 Tax=Streptomyces longwoodensis TaxID=68231 RepID=UPI0033DC54E5
MLLRLPTSLSEARECVAEGAVPIGGATLVWATFQRDGFPEQAVSLRQLPQATAIGPDVLGSAVRLHQVDDRVPEVLRAAAATVGTGAVRRTATVGGNIVGSTLRCLLPAALVLDARATVLEQSGAYETDLAEVVEKRQLLLSIRWRVPLTSGYHKAAGEAGGPPPLVVASAVHAEGGEQCLRVAVRDGYDVLRATVPCGTGVDPVLDALERSDLATLPTGVRATVHAHVRDVLARSGDR